MIFRSFAYFLGIYLFIFRILEKEKSFPACGPALGPRPLRGVGWWPIVAVGRTARWPIWRHGLVISVAQRCKARGTRVGAQSPWPKVSRAARAH
jgi:hypothetical protein